MEPKLQHSLPEPRLEPVPPQGREPRRAFWGHPLPAQPTTTPDTHRRPFGRNKGTILPWPRLLVAASPLSGREGKVAARGFLPRAHRTGTAGTAERQNKRLENTTAHALPPSAPTLGITPTFQNSNGNNLH